MKKIIIFAILSFGIFAETVKVNLDSIITKHPKFEVMKTDLEKEKQNFKKFLILNKMNLIQKKPLYKLKGTK